MKDSTILWTLAVLLLAAFTPQASAESDVITLTDKNFKEQVFGEDLMLVEFYAPWCGHCKALAPEYEKAATELKSHGIKLAKVDCTENQDLCSNDYEVRGYPTLKVFRKENHSEYKGSRKTDGIVKYMIKQSSPAVTELTPENFDTFKASDRVVVVGYASESDTNARATFQTIAEKLRDDYLFGFVSSADMAEEHKVNTLPSVILYKQFDEGRNDQSGELKETDIEEFIKTNSIPLLDEVDASNFQTYFEAGLPLAYLFADSKEMLQPLVEAISPIARKYKGKVNFVHIDAKKYGGHADNVGLKQQWPGFTIQNLENGAKYPFDQSLEITTDSIDNFVTEFVAGNIKPSLKSEEPPTENDEPVKTVVAKEFDQIVLNKDKDVFLEVYAPWCGHCKRLAPIWTQLGELVRDQSVSEKLVIAKLDGTANDIPESAKFEVSGFPTLKFIKAETNEVIDYDGDRSLKNLIEFINTHSSVKVTYTDDAQSEDTGHDEL